jgi:hypothetical protein
MVCPWFGGWPFFMLFLGNIFDIFGVGFVGYRGSSALGDSDVLSLR